MILDVHHVGIVVRSLEAAYGFYRDALGLPVVKEDLGSTQGARAALLAVGGSYLELMEARDEASPFAGFIAERGEGLHHVCLAVEDIEAAMERLQAAGARLLSEEPRVGTHGTRYVFVHPRSAHGVLLELYEGTK